MVSKYRERSLKQRKQINQVERYPQVNAGQLRGRPESPYKTALRLVPGLGGPNRMRWLHQATKARVFVNITVRLGYVCVSQTFWGETKGVELRPFKGNAAGDTTRLDTRGREKVRHGMQVKAELGKRKRNSDPIDGP